MSEALDKFLKTSIGNLTVEKILSTVLIFLLCYILIRYITKFTAKTLNKFHIEKTLHGFINSSVKVFLWFLAVVITLGTLGIPVTSLVAAFSVVGVAVSLSIQGVLSNIAGGILILSSKPFKVGDYVETANVGGTVCEIGMVHTKLSTIDNKAIYVPNSTITGSQITNYSANSTRRVDIPIAVSYDSPTDNVLSALQEAIQNTGLFLPEPAAFAGILSFGESSVNYIIRAWTKTETYWDAYFALNAQIRISFAKHGVELTYNHLNVHIKDKT